MAKETKCKPTNKIVKENKRRKHESSSSSSECDSDSDSDYTYESDDDEKEEFNIHEYRKLLNDVFPSQHINKKIAAGEKLKAAALKSKNAISKQLSDSPKPKTKGKAKSNATNKDKVSRKCKDIESESESDYEEEEPIKKSKKIVHKANGKDKIVEVASDSSSSSESESEEEDIDKSRKNKFNIVFTIDANGAGEDDDDEDWVTDEDDSDYEEEEDENEDEDVSDEDDEDEDEESTEEGLKTKTSKATKESILKENEDLLKSLKTLQESNNSTVVEDCVKKCEENIKNVKKKQEKCLKKQKDKNGRIFKKQLREKNTMNDFAFFKKLEIDQQKHLIKELREINGLIRVEKPYRLSLLESNMPNIFKAAAMKRVNALKHMEQGSGEFYKIKNWVDTFMKIPFGIYEKLPINITNGVDSCHDFMAGALAKLDDAVYGLNDAKMQVMQMLGQLISNPNAIGGSVALKGPPGTGKTSLIKEGISKILNRPFAFIALGGATDSSFLEGHSYTYEGSTWGKIVQIIIDSKCMNPVIYFDELDKISETPKGEEIAGILTHLTDSTQNSQFHDKYFSEVDFDLSKCLFIFSYNDETKVSPILRDRMYKIQTKGYDKKQKTIIANKYLLPKIREQVKFEEGSIKITDDALSHIIDTLCAKEEGVRNLKRCLEIIHTKLNLYRLMKPETNLFEQEISLKVEFPFTVTKAIVDKLIKPNCDPETWRNLYN